MMYKVKDKSQDDGNKSYLKRVSMGLYVYLYSLGILKYFFFFFVFLTYFILVEKKKKGVSNHYSKFLMELLIVINKLKSSLYILSFL